MHACMGVFLKSVEYLITKSCFSQYLISHTQRKPSTDVFATSGHTVRSVQQAQNKRIMRWDSEFVTLYRV